MDSTSQRLRAVCAASCLLSLPTAKTGGRIYAIYSFKFHFRHNANSPKDVPFGGFVKKMVRRWRQKCSESWSSSWRKNCTVYTDFDYADDVVLMAKQTETLRSALLEFHQIAANLGLHLS